MILTVLIIIFTCLVTYAGYCNAIMDLISPKDALAHRGWKWTKEAMEETKDRNHDGHISWYESAWPDDEWHNHKREMNGAIGVACANLIGIGFTLSFYPLKMILTCSMCFAFAPIFFFIISSSFEYFYTHIKK